LNLKYYTFAEGYDGWNNWWFDGDDVDVPVFVYPDYVEDLGEVGTEECDPGWCNGHRKVFGYQLFSNWDQEMPNRLVREDVWFTGSDCQNPVMHQFNKEVSTDFDGIWEDRIGKCTYVAGYECCGGGYESCVEVYHQNTYSSGYPVMSRTLYLWCNDVYVG
jgi:hypothetical protein